MTCLSRSQLEKAVETACWFSGLTAPEHPFLRLLYKTLPIYSYHRKFDVICGKMMVDPTSSAVCVTMCRRLLYSSYHSDYLHLSSTTPLATPKASANMKTVLAPKESPQWVALFRQCPDLVTILLRELQLHCLVNSPPLADSVGDLIRLPEYRRIITCYMNRWRSYMHTAVNMSMSTWNVAFGDAASSDVSDSAFGGGGGSGGAAYAMERLVQDIHTLLRDCESELHDHCYYRLPNLDVDELLKPLTNRLPLMTFTASQDQALQRIVFLARPTEAGAMDRCIDQFGNTFGINVATCAFWRQCCSDYETQSVETEVLKRRILVHGQDYHYAYTLVQLASRWIKRYNQRLFTVTLPLQTLERQLQHYHVADAAGGGVERLSTSACGVGVDAILLDEIVYSVCPSCRKTSSLIVCDDACRFWIQTEAASYYDKQQWSTPTLRAKKWNKRRNEDARRLYRSAISRLPASAVSAMGAMSTMHNTNTPKKRKRGIGDANGHHSNANTIISPQLLVGVSPPPDWTHTSEAPRNKTQGFVGSCVSLVDDQVYCKVCTQDAEHAMKFIVLLGQALIVPETHQVIVLCAQRGCGSLMQLEDDTPYNLDYWMCGRCESLHHQRVFEESLQRVCSDALPSSIPVGSSGREEWKTCSMCRKVLLRHEHTFVYPCRILLCAKHHRKELPKILDDKAKEESIKNQHFIMNATWVKGVIEAHHEARALIIHNRNVRRFKPSTYVSQQMQRNRGR